MAAASQTLIILALFLLQASDALESKFPPITTECGKSKFRDTAFLNKVSLLQFSVAALTPLSGFFSTKIDGARANARCQGDLKPETCSDCIASAITTLRESCGFSKMSRTWLEKCYVEYSIDAEALDKSRFGFARALCSKTRLSIKDEVIKRRMNALLDSIIETAANDDKRYASKEDQLSTTLFLQGMAQCNRDYNIDLCQGCLKSARSKAKESCENNVGFHIMGTGCVLRLENYLFINT